MDNIQQALEDLSHELNRLDPEAQIVPSGKTFGDEDITIFVTVIESQLDRIQKFLDRETLRLFLECDVDIVALVRPKRRIAA